MALGGLAPIIIFNFYKEIAVPDFLKGFITATKIPLIPIPIYLDERFSKIALDDYDRTTSVDVMRDGVTGFERVSGDVSVLRFTANKSNIAVTALAALIGRIVKSNIEKRTYSLTVFYDDIFILEASLEQFQSKIREGTDLREITITVSERPAKPTVTGVPIPATVGTAAGILGG